MKEFCKDSKEYVMKIIICENKEMIPVTNKENKLYHKQKACHIYKKEFSTDDNDKKYYKVRDHCHYTRKYRSAALSVFILRYKTPKEISVDFIIALNMTIIL